MLGLVLSQRVGEPSVSFSSVTSPRLETDSPKPSQNPGLDLILSYLTFHFGFRVVDFSSPRRSLPLSLLIALLFQG